MSTCANYGLRRASARVPLANERQMKHEERLVSLEKKACLGARVCLLLNNDVSCLLWESQVPPGRGIGRAAASTHVPGKATKVASSLFRAESSP